LVAEEITLLTNTQQLFAGGIVLLIFGILLEKHFTSPYTIVANILGALILLSAIPIFTQDFVVVSIVSISGIMILGYGVWKLRKNEVIPFVFGSKMMGSLGLYVALNQSDYLMTDIHRIASFFIILSTSYLLCFIAIKKKWRLLSKAA
jgi:hypothetical protein